MPTVNFANVAKIQMDIPTKAAPLIGGEEKRVLFAEEAPNLKFISEFFFYFFLKFVCFLIFILLKNDQFINWN